MASPPRFIVSTTAAARIALDQLSLWPVRHPQFGPSEPLTPSAEEVRLRAIEAERPSVLFDGRLRRWRTGKRPVRVVARPLQRPEHAADQEVARQQQPIGLILVASGSGPAVPREVGLIRKMLESVRWLR